MNGSIFKSSNKDNHRHYQKLLISKGVYPYKLTGQDFDHLPAQEHFANDLTNQPCSDSDYKKAQEVYKSFGCENFRDYHDLYLTTDVLLLADVFENFRTKGLELFKIDPAYYISLPSYANDCLYRYTKQRSELLTEQDDYEFAEKSIRGGISFIGAKRFSKANNKYMTDYNPNDLST